MVKVKTFTNKLEIFHTINQLKELDDQVNKFIAEEKVQTVISVSDTSTVGEGGTIGIIRVLAYETV